MPSQQSVSADYALGHCHFTGNVHCLSARHLLSSLPLTRFFELVNSLTQRRHSHSVRFQLFSLAKLALCSQTLFFCLHSQRVCLPLATINNCPFFFVSKHSLILAYGGILRAKVVDPKNADRHRSISELTFGLVPKVQQSKQK